MRSPYLRYSKFLPFIYAVVKHSHQLMDYITLEFPLLSPVDHLRDYFDFWILPLYVYVAICKVSYLAISMSTVHKSSPLKDY